MKRMGKRILMQWKTIRKNRNNRLRILLEDENIICVYKPPGLLSQGDETGDPDLVTLLKKHCRSEHAPFIGLVHRLDRPASGVMVFARSPDAASHLSRQIRLRQFKKVYLAVVHGQPGPRGHMEDYILVDRVTRRSTVCTMERAGTPPAILDYRVIERHSGRSLMEIHLVTGKKHQIRAQLSQYGYPIVGDRKYGSREVLRDPGMIALCAWKLEFSHPVTQRRISITSPRPQHWPWHTSLFQKAPVK
jgi:23S rRNA pseudouridine1911/1915/1917 synthase